LWGACVKGFYLPQYYFGVKTQFGLESTPFEGTAREPNLERKKAGFDKGKQ